MMKIANLISLVLVALILTFTPLSTDAAVIALYDFTGQTTLPAASNDIDSGSTASSLSWASTATSGISTSTGNPPNSLFLNYFANSSEALAVSGNRYLTFSITPTDSLSFNSLIFDLRRDSSNSISNFSLRTDAGGDNFTTTVASGSFTGVSTSLFSAQTLDLSSVSALQNVTAAVTARLYVWNPSAAATAISRFDNITLNATVVPEPNSYKLLLLGGIATFVLRRRRANWQPRSPT